MQGSRSKPCKMSSREDLTGCIKSQPLRCTCQEEKKEETEEEGAEYGEEIHQEIHRHPSAQV